MAEHVCVTVYDIFFNAKLEYDYEFKLKLASKLAKYE